LWFATPIFQKAMANTPFASVERQLLPMPADLENQTAQGSAKLLLKADDLLVNLHIPNASNKVLAVSGTPRLSHCPFDFATKVQRMLMNLIIAGCNAATRAFGSWGQGGWGQGDPIAIGHRGLSEWSRSGRQANRGRLGARTDGAMSGGAYGWCERSGLTAQVDTSNFIALVCVAIIIHLYRQNP
jgi:hypothetical protein